MAAHSSRALALIERIFAVSLLILLAVALGRAADKPKPPTGFTALFNGKDLSGWWGATTEDPRKYLAMKADEFKKKHDTSLDDVRKHWRVEDGILINDGGGQYLTT